MMNTLPKIRVLYISCHIAVITKHIARFLIAVAGCVMVVS